MKKKLSFAVVGILTAAFGFLLLWLLVAQGVSKTVAWPIQAIVSIQLNFILNRKFTWADAQIGWLESWLKFMAVRITGNLVGAWTIYSALAFVMPFSAANLLTTVILSGYGYFAAEKVVFGTKKTLNRPFMVMISNFMDRKALSEYAFYLHQGLESNIGRVPVVTTKQGDIHPSAIRCFDHGVIYFPLQIIAKIWQLQPQTILVNTSFSSWGGNVANLLGLLLSALLRALGFKVIVLMHDLPHTMDTQNCGYKLRGYHWMAINFACRLVAFTNRVIFTQEHNSQYFSAHFGGQVETIPHGILGEFSLGEMPKIPTVLLFGKWGRAKQLDTVLEGLAGFTGRIIVAGTSADSCPGYYESITKTFGQYPNITFTGYIAEEEIPDLFHSASVVVLPHRSNPGCSGVLHQAVQFGRPLLARDLPGFRQMASELNVEIDLFTDDQDLAVKCQAMVEEMSRLDVIRQRNYNAVQHLTMDAIARRYLLAAMEVNHVAQKQSAFAGNSFSSFIDGGNAIQ